VSEIRYKAWGTVRYATENVPTKYQYTGQYSYEAEFGLYFYNARWYDPVLSRFAQADSIVPSGVQGWDRYAYVNNNPLAYTDPSGHKPAECEIKCVPRSVLDRSKLSPVGRDLYDTYIKLWNKSTGWWWGLYGADGDFTIDEFMAMNWHYEQANYGSLKGYNAAVRNAASSWQLASGCQNTSYTCDVSTAEGSLNFLGYYSEVAENRADACGNSPCNLNKQFNPTFWDKESGKRLVIAIYNAQPRNEFDDDEPFAVGNVSMNEAVYRKMLKRGWTGPFIGGKNPMFVLSYCQATFAWWAIAQGNSNHTSPLNYLTGSNYFCN
jgi:RHS repeat-associated protein